MPLSGVTVVPGLLAVIARSLPFGASAGPISSGVVSVGRGLHAVECRGLPVVSGSGTPAGTALKNSQQLRTIAGGTVAVPSAVQPVDRRGNTIVAGRAASDTGQLLARGGAEVATLGGSVTDFCLLVGLVSPPDQGAGDDVPLQGDLVAGVANKVPAVSYPVAAARGLVPTGGGAVAIVGLAVALIGLAITRTHLTSP